jgi:hypothetical protein
MPELARLECHFQARLQIRDGGIKMNLNSPRSTFAVLFATCGFMFLSGCGGSGSSGSADTPTVSAKTAVVNAAGDSRFVIAGRSVVARPP